MRELGFGTASGSGGSVRGSGSNSIRGSGSNSLRPGGICSGGSTTSNWGKISSKLGGGGSKKKTTLEQVPRHEITHFSLRI